MLAWSISLVECRFAGGRLRDARALGLRCVDLINSHSGVTFHAALERVLDLKRRYAAHGFRVLARLPHAEASVAVLSIVVEKRETLKTRQAANNGALLIGEAFGRRPVARLQRECDESCKHDVS